MRAPSFGLSLNCGGEDGRSHDEVFELALAEAELAEQLGYRDVWVTEHHFIPFGVNPSALAMASFLLGRTRRLRVGTARHAGAALPPAPARRAGGAPRSALWRPLRLRRRARRLPARLRRVRHRSVALGPRGRGDARSASTPASVERAARLGAPLLHYFATPLEVRARVEAAYRLAAEQAGHDSGAAPHVHVLTTWVTDDETGARVRLRENLLPSFAAREHPRVAQAGNRHVGPDGRPLDRGMLADFAARGALVGSPARLAETLAPLHNEQGIRRFVLYMEPIAERDELLESIERFAKEVAPQLTAEVGCTNGSTRS